MSLDADLGWVGRPRATEADTDPTLHPIHPLPPTHPTHPSHHTPMPTPSPQSECALT
jgi:hypothetical protein